MDRRKGFYDLFIKMRSEAGNRELLKSGVSELVKDDFGSNLYIHMADELVSAVLFHNPFITHIDRIAFDLPTRMADRSEYLVNQYEKLGYSDVSIDIIGFTDNTGSDKINNPLSLNRAQSVANYLTQNGVPYAQLKNVQGFGSSNPVASNETAEGRQQNRRVEVYLYASEQMIKAAEAQSKQ